MRIRLHIVFLNDGLCILRESDLSVLQVNMPDLKIHSKNERLKRADARY